MRPTPLIFLFFILVICLYFVYLIYVVRLYMYICIYMCVYYVEVHFSPSSHDDEWALVRESTDLFDCASWWLPSMALHVHNWISSLCPMYLVLRWFVSLIGYAVKRRGRTCAVIDAAKQEILLLFLLFVFVCFFLRQDNVHRVYGSVGKCRTIKKKIKTRLRE